MMNVSARAFAIIKWKRVASSTNVWWRAHLAIKISTATRWRIKIYIKKGGRNADTKATAKGRGWIHLQQPSNCVPASTAAITKLCHRSNRHKQQIRDDRRRSFSTDSKIKTEPLKCCCCWIECCVRSWGRVRKCSVGHIIIKCKYPVVVVAGPLQLWK